MTLPDSIPLRRESPMGAGFGDSADFSGLAAIGLLLIFAIFAVAWWRKHHAPRGDANATNAPQPRWARWLGAQRSKRVTPLGSTRLTPKHSLHEIEWQGKRLLIGCAEQSICLLAEMPVAAPDSPPTDTTVEGATP